MKNQKTKVYVGMDVHKDTVMVAVLPAGAREPTVVKRLSHDPRGVRRLLDRLAREHEVRACYEASGPGYVPLGSEAWLVHFGGVHIRYSPEEQRRAKPRRGKSILNMTYCKVIFTVGQAWRSDQRGCIAARMPGGFCPRARPRRKGRATRDRDRPASGNTAGAGVDRRNMRRDIGLPRQHARGAGSGCGRARFIPRRNRAVNNANMSAISARGRTPARAATA